MLVSAETFRVLGQSFQQRAGQDRDFRALFGICPDVVADLWRQAQFPSKAEPKHLLWALMFLKTYATEPMLCAIAGTTRKTFRKWSWPVVTAIASISFDVVSTKCMSV